MDLMDEPIQRILKHQGPPPTNDKLLLLKLEDHNEKPTNFTDLYDHFLYPYEEAVFMILRLLFVRITATVMSEKDKQSLHTRIIILLNKLTTQIFDVSLKSRYLDFTILELKSFRLSTTKTFAKNNKIDIGVRQNIIQMIEDFKKNFLA